MFLERCQILFNQSEGVSVYRVGIQVSRRYSEAMPGQFVMLRFSDQQLPLLNRPFSIHDIIDDQQQVVTGIEVLYKTIGAFTRKLSMCKPGDSIEMMGPLGKPFTMSSTRHRFYIVAGGVGIAPMAFLFKRLAGKGANLSGSRVFIGSRSSDELVIPKVFSAHDANVIITTDDGTAGEKGFITTAVERYICQDAPDMIYACGPMPMLKAMQRIAKTSGVPCQISIETMMACGIGVCLGCAMESLTNPDKYFHACVDGPVFDADSIKMT